MTLENLTTLEERLSGGLSSLGSSTSKLKEEGFLPINISEIGEDLWKVIAQFAPFGMGNPKPIFRIKGEVKSIKQFGKEKNHLEVILADEKGREVKGISFFSTPDAYTFPLVAGVPCTLLANLEKSYFRNRPELRLRIVDIIP